MENKQIAIYAIALIAIAGLAYFFVFGSLHTDNDLFKSCNAISDAAPIDVFAKNGETFEKIASVIANDCKSRFRIGNDNTSREVSSAEFYAFIKSKTGLYATYSPGAGKEKLSIEKLPTK